MATVRQWGAGADASLVSAFELALTQKLRKLAALEGVEGDSNAMLTRLAARKAVPAAAAAECEASLLRSEAALHEVLAMKEEAAAMLTVVDEQRRTLLAPGVLLLKELAPDTGVLERLGLVPVTAEELHKLQRSHDAVDAALATLANSVAPLDEGRLAQIEGDLGRRADALRQAFTRVVEQREGAMRAHAEASARRSLGQVSCGASQLHRYPSD